VRTLTDATETIATGSKGGRLGRRLVSRRGGTLLARNTVVSIGVFLFGLGMLWLLVERFGVAKIPAAGLSFIASNSIHYVFGRTWIYRGTERRLVAGYAFFLVNAAVGLAATLLLFAVFMALGLNYILARVVASLFVGLLLFVLNAVLNFRSL
jgi:putative flippase GtrA